MYEMTGDTRSMKKIDPGLSAGDIIAFIFVLLGGVFAAVSIAIALNLDKMDVRTSGGAEPEMLPMIFALIGVPFLAIGICFAAHSLWRRKVIRHVVEEGCSVMANVVAVSPNFTVTVNGRHPYVMECHYIDPLTGSLHVFYSRNLFYCPSEFIGRQVKVYVGRDDLKHYYVDVPDTAVF
jgi:hypothetical protein